MHKPIDLDALEAQHAEEEAREAARSLLETPRPRRVRRPEGGHLPQSAYWLDRFYAFDRFPREKKPGVFDHLRSSGPWMVSVDDDPLVVLDAMSQTATVCDGFNEDPVVKAYVEGGFADTMLRCGDTTLEDDQAELEFEATLKRMIPELPCVTFVNSGAEAIEKAFALCHNDVEDPSTRRILAFEGSFHGRTLLALHATWNPAKRAPFELEGFEAGFAPFPVWNAPTLPSPELHPNEIQAISEGRLHDLRDDSDPLRSAELASLTAVDQQLTTGAFCCVIIEPMQSEGGDRYATHRFFQALRLLTRYHRVPLIMDEVQTGFGLGGSFLWHRQFGLVDANGNPDYPDVITFAKRAQVGVVISRFPDTEPTHTHTASLVRGRIRAEMVADSAGASRVENLVRPRLERIANAYPQLVAHPRSLGYAFAFDLPTPGHLNALLGQRFWRGAVVFGAGDRTARYRLADCWSEPEIETLFDAIRRSLSWLDAHPGKQPPAWEDLPTPAPPEREEVPFQIKRLRTEDADRYMPWILDLEARTYEPARRDPPEKLRRAFEHPAGLAVVAEAPDADGNLRPVGVALAVPLELATNINGPKQDLMLGRHNTLYSLAISVDAAYRNSGLGRALKVAQVQFAATMTRPDGSPRYRYVTGRNRVGQATAMTGLNRSLGAHPVDIFYGAYGSADGQALYYRLPVGPLVPGIQFEPEDYGDTLDVASGLTAPLKTPPAALKATLHNGLIAGPTLTKITICNYITPAIVRAVEHITALTPHHPHLYLANGRDETVDLTLRTLKWHRKNAAVAIGLEGGYVGHTTAAARSISDPSTHLQGPTYFPWPRTPHPARVGTPAAIQALRDAIHNAGGPDRVFGIFVEPLQERFGHVLPHDFWTALGDLRRETGVPIVAAETATAAWRSGLGPFVHPTLPVQPDIVTWFGGGQVGFVHLQPQVFVPNPLTMVSTWAGDELSLFRLHHQLRAIRSLDLPAAIQRFEDALTPLLDHNIEVRGLGLYRVLNLGPKANRFREELRHNGVRIYPLGQGLIALIPPFDLTAEDMADLREKIAIAIKNM